jgi:5-methylcytosine-specific restriction protein B
MIPYQEYEKAVYDWLLNKRELDPNFTFSTRIKGSKGSELDYFIGTEKSGYFGFTLWNIPVSFPGSAGDVIDIFCGYTQHGISYYIQFVQTESPKDLQNELVLKV